MPAPPSSVARAALVLALAALALLALPAAAAARTGEWRHVWEVVQLVQKRPPWGTPIFYLGDSAARESTVRDAPLDAAAAPPRGGGWQDHGDGRLHARQPRADVPHGPAAALGDAGTCGGSAAGHRGHRRGAQPVHRSAGPSPARGRRAAGFGQGAGASPLGPAPLRRSRALAADSQVRAGPALDGPPLGRVPSLSPRPTCAPSTGCWR